MDKKAKKILFETYWTAKGWKNEYITSDEDFEYAKSKGLMFDPISISHDDLVAQVIDLRDSISYLEILKGLLISFSNRDLRLRSAFLSFLNIQQLAIHEFKPGQALYNRTHLCENCSMQQFEKEVNLNVLNFERLKWGGVRHSSLVYNLFDLQQFKLITIPEPTNEHIKMLKGLLYTIETSNDTDTVKELEKRLQNAIPSNNYEREQLIDILAHLRIIHPPCQNWPEEDKVYYELKKHWRGKDKFDDEMVQYHFKTWF